MKSTIKKSEVYIFTFLLLLSVLTPPLDLSDEIPSLRLELVFVFLAWFMIVMKKMKARLLNILKSLPVYKWFVFLALSFLVSMAYGTLIKGQEVIFADYFELLKIVQYFLTFALIARMNFRDDEFVHVYLISIIIFLISAMVVFSQYADLFDINTWFTPYYVSTQIETVLDQTRLTGTTGNPNETGALMAFAAVLAVSGGFIFKERRMTIFLWCAFIIFSFALFLTASRSALITLLVAIISSLVIILYSGALKRNYRQIFIFLFFCCLLGLIILQFGTDKMLNRFIQLESLEQVTSLQARQDNWETHFELWQRSYLLGWGPAKASMSTIVDNEWLYFLRRYGIIGTAVFIGFAGSFFRGLSHIRRVNREKAVAALSIALQAILIGYAIYMIPAVVYHALQLMPILLILLGLAYSRWRTTPIV